MNALRPILLSAVCVLLAGCGADRTPPTPPAAKPTVPLSGDPAAYAGSKRCAECHAAEHEKWKNSHHARAEQDVPPDVLAEAFAPGKPFQHATQQTLRAGDKRRDAGNEDA